MLEFYMRKMPNIDFQEADLSKKQKTKQNKNKQTNKKNRINFVIK